MRADMVFCFGVTARCEALPLVPVLYRAAIASIQYSSASPHSSTAKPLTYHDEVVPALAGALTPGAGGQKQKAPPERGQSNSS
jgi:hypothetical protein